MLEFNGIGRLVQPLEVEMKKVESGEMAFGQMRLAFDNGGDKPATFMTMDVWGKQAENAAKYLDKGSLVQVKGVVINNNYQNKDGEKVYSNKYTASTINYLDSKKQSPELGD